MKRTRNALDTSIKKIDNKLIVSLDSDMDDGNLESMRGIIARRVHKSGVSGVILDFSMVKVISSYTYGIFKSITMSISLLGADVVWVGLRPGVVVALMDLDLMDNTQNIKTGLNIEQGLELLSGGNGKNA